MFLHENHEIIYTEKLMILFSGISGICILEESV